MAITRTFMVHMLANHSEDDVIRNVEVPVDELAGPITESLDRIYYWGQNDFQPVDGICSVSVGDVIDFHTELYLVTGGGFLPFTWDHLKTYRELNHSERRGAVRLMTLQEGS